MNKRKTALIVLAVFLFTILFVLGTLYLLLTGPFGPPHMASVDIYVYTGKPVRNVTIIIPMIYIKNKPFYKYVKIKGWDYRVVETKYGKMLKLHTDEVYGSKVVCKGTAFSIPVVELNREFKIEPAKIENVSIQGSNPAIRALNYSVVVFTSTNMSVLIDVSICSGISLFEPMYNGRKYCGCRWDKIVASGRGWIYGEGQAKIRMWFRKHWYDL